MPVIANLVKIGRAQAVLHTSQPPVLRVGQALQVPGQRVHPRGGEQHRTRRYFDRQGDAELAVLHHSIAVNSQTDAQRRIGIRYVPDMNYRYNTAMTPPRPKPGRKWRTSGDRGLNRISTRPGQT